MQAVIDPLPQDLYSVTPNLDKKPLDALQKSLGQLTVEWMKKISQSSKEALKNYTIDLSYTRKNIWYAEDLLKACQKCKQPKMSAFIRNNANQYLPSDFFDRIKEEKTGKWRHVVKTTVLPSEALKAAIKGLSIIDCGVACQLARYGALLDVLKEERFNRIFGGAVGQLLNVSFSSRDDKFQPMNYFVNVTQSSKEGEMGARPIKVGQVVAIGGVENYKERYPFGVWGNINVVCSNEISGQQRFIGLGTNPEGDSESKICSQLLENNNKIEDPFFLASDTSNFKDMKWENMTPSKIELFKKTYTQLFPPAQQVQGYDSTSPEEFIVEIVNDLIELPLEEVSMEFVRNHWINKDRVFV